MLVGMRIGKNVLIVNNMMIQEISSQIARVPIFIESVS